MASAAGFRSVLLGFFGNPVCKRETLEAAGALFAPDCDRDQPAASCGRQYALLHAHLSRGPLVVELHAGYSNHTGKNCRSSSEPCAASRTEFGCRTAGFRWKLGTRN